MQEIKYVKRKDTTELLNFNIEQFLYEVWGELDIYDACVSDNHGQIKGFLNDVIEIGQVEQKPKADSTRGVYIKGNGSGKFYFIRNIRFCLLDCIEGILSLITIEKKYIVIACAIFLAKFMKGIGLALEEEQTAVIVALYLEAKHRVVTDENLEEVIAHGLENRGYQEMDTNKIREEIEHLVDWGIIEIEDGKYTIAHKIYF